MYNKNMLQINIIAVGTQEKYYADATGEYIKRLQKYCKLKITEIKHSNQKREVESIRQAIPEKGKVFLCDINGTEISSELLAKKIEQLSLTNSVMTFIIGGSDGVGNYLDNQIHEKISFGKITLPHQLFRVILTEQIYRAFTISNNEKYHR